MSISLPNPSHFLRKDYSPIDGFLYFHLPASPGQYLLTIHPPIETADIYELSCSNPLTSTLLSGRTEYRALSAAIPELHFRIYVSEVGLLDIVAEACSGHIAMDVEGERGDRGDVVTRKGSGKVQTEVVNALGVYFVTMQIDKHSENADFQLSYQFFPKSARQPPQIVPGNAGLLAWKALNSDTIALNWTAPALEDSSAVVLYLVYVTNRTREELDSVCAVRTAESRGTAWALKGLYSSESYAQVKVHKVQLLVVNVISLVQTSSISLHLAYIPTEVFIHSSESWGALAMYGSIVVLCVVLAGFAVSVRKSRQAQRMSESEMKNLRDSRYLQGERAQEGYQTIDLT